MVIVILCVALGVFLAYKRVKQFLMTRTAIQEAIKRGQKLQLLRLSTGNVILFLITAGLAGFALYRYIADPVTTAVCALLILLSIGEIFGAITVKDFYYDEHGFFYCNKYFKYSEVKKLTTQKGIVMMYGVETTTNDLFSVSKQAYEIIAKHSKK